MYNKWLEANPKDIVWENLDDGAFEMRIRKVISWAITFGLILAWSFPAAFIGTLSNVDSLCTEVK
jgi:calcium permeable stress-gated cation channel